MVGRSEFEAGQFSSTIVAFLIAAGLHVQFALQLGSAKVQLALSDLVVALVAVPAIVLLKQQRKRWWNSPAQRVLISVVLLTAALGVAALIRVIDVGVSPWALKKLAGWPALLGYALVVGLFAYRFPAFPRLFSAAYVVIAVLIALPGVLLGYAQLLNLTDLRFYNSWQLYGLAEKPISYILLTLLAILLVDNVRKMANGLKYLRFLFYVVLYSAIFFSDSRAGLLACALVSLLWIIQARRYSKPATAGLVATAVLLTASFGIEAASDRKARPTVVQRLAVGTGNVNSGESRARLDQYRYGWEIYKKSPVLGAGLGAYVADAPKMPNGQSLVIHNTAFWFLVEAGPFGLLALVAFVLSCLLTFWPWRSDRSRGDAYIEAAFWLLVAAGMISLVHEILYQRILWVALGLGLASVVVNRAQDTPETAQAPPSGPA